MNNFFPVHPHIISKEIINGNLHRDCIPKHNRDMETLAKRLADTRRERGLSQAELAKKAGLKNQSNIANLESGHRKSSTYIPAIAEALGVEPLWLSEGKGHKYRIGIASESDLLAVLGLTKEDLSFDQIERMRAFVKEPKENQIQALEIIKEEATKCKQDANAKDRRSSDDSHHYEGPERRALEDRRAFIHKPSRGMRGGAIKPSPDDE